MKTLRGDEKLTVEGDFAGKFPTKDALYQAVKAYLKTEKYKKGCAPYIFKDRTGEAEARRGDYGKR